MLVLKTPYTKTTKEYQHKKLLTVEIEKKYLEHDSSKVTQLMKICMRPRHDVSIGINENQLDPTTIVTSQLKFANRIQ